MNAIYQQEVIQRQQEVIRALQNELDWEKRLFSNTSLKPPDKLILWKTTPQEVKRGQAIEEQPEEKKLYITRLADEVGISSDTFGSRLQRLAETSGALVHRREREPAQDGTPVWRVYIAPTPALAAPEKIELPTIGQGHGGRRVKKCASCGSHALVETRQIVCTNCGHAEEKTAHLVNGPDENTTPQDDGSPTISQDQESTSPQDDGSPVFFVPATPQLDEVLPPVTPPILAQVSPAVEVATVQNFERLPDGKMTPGDDLLEEWLSRRIGTVPHKLIKATGKMTSTDKYISLPEDHVLDMSAYLRGELEHIYGSNLRNTDGTTQVLEFDYDRVEQSLLKFDILRLLANAGAAAICWTRRPGRGHLGIYFDAPVNAQAAYQWAITVCPLLAAFKECYPVEGLEDKRNQRLSWPLWYRDRNQVIECAAIAMLPGADKPVHCAGIKSDPEGLRAIVAQAVTPAALIPERIVTQATDEAPAARGVLLDKPLECRTACSQSTDVAKLAIRAWNDAHTWEEIAEVRNGRFLASWRKEKTPSVVIDPDGYYACDHGNHGSFPKKLDRFEAWCLINGLDRRTEKERLCVAYRELEV